MRRRALAIAATASALVVVGAWEAGALAHTPKTTTASAPVPVERTTGGATPSTGKTGSTAAPSATAEASASAKDGTYQGQTVSTDYGDVQVQVTIAGGRISDVTALHLTDRESRSVAISNQAAPILHDEVLQAQSANVSMVSGATFTSQGYLQSLQSALDQAGFTG